MFASTQPWLSRIALGAALVLCAAPLVAEEPAASEEFAPEHLEYFEKSVRPVLVAHCYECHSAKKQESGLRLDSRAAVLTGGESGPAVVPGEPDKSLLVSALHYADDGPQMPPTQLRPW
jgi:hypothetical protein